jgi:hypothetical protein
MSRRYVLIPVLVTLVVLVVALYPNANVTQRASAAPRAAVVTKYLMIPAAAFNPEEDGLNYYSLGYNLSGTGVFVAPVYLPPGARVRLIKIFAWDLNPGFDIKDVCTTGSSGTQQPITYVSHYVKWYYGYYIRLNFPSSFDLVANAVMIRYTVNQ